MEHKHPWKLKLADDFLGKVSVCTRLAQLVTPNLGVQSMDGSFTEELDWINPSGSPPALEYSVKCFAQWCEIQIKVPSKQSRYQEDKTKLKLYISQ